MTDLVHCVAALLRREIAKSSTTVLMESQSDKFMKSSTDLATVNNPNNLSPNQPLYNPNNLFVATFRACQALFAAATVPTCANCDYQNY
jgi:hypothetical protein